MTNLELNQAIGKIKGWHFIDANKDNCRFERYDIEDVEVAITAERNWATHIEDAWELFEELPIGSGIQRFEACYLVSTSATPPICNDAATTAPQAICLAWLKWKEGQSK